MLLKTRNSSRGVMQREEFDEGYAAISDDAAKHLVELGTVGMAYLSVEPFEDGGFHTHHALLEATSSSSRGSCSRRPSRDPTSSLASR